MIKYILSNIVSKLFMDKLGYDDNSYNQSFFKFILPINFRPKTIFAYALNTCRIAHLRNVDHYNNAIIESLPMINKNDKQCLRQFITLLINKLKKIRGLKIKKIYWLYQINRQLNIFLYYKNEPYIISFYTDSYSLYLEAPAKRLKYKKQLMLKIKHIIYSFLKDYLVLNDKINHILNTLVNYVKTRNLLPQAKFVILLYGPPGTGKTTIATLLQTLLSLRIKYTIDSYTNVHNQLEKMFREEDSQLIAFIYSDGIGFEIVDEFDSYIAIKDDLSLNARRNTGVIKKVLDKAKDIVILITNQVENLDDSILRDGRIDLKIKVDKDFYSEYDKKRILKMFLKNFKIDKTDLIYDEVMKLDYANETIASLLNKAQLIIYKYRSKNFFNNVDPEMDRKIDKYFSEHAKAKSVEILTNLKDTPCEIQQAINESFDELLKEEFEEHENE